MGLTKERIQFYPFAYALYESELTSYCWYCLKELAKPRKCLGCNFAIFCNTECQQNGWKDHKAECVGFLDAEVIPDIEVRHLGRIVIRQKDILAGKDITEKNFYTDRHSERKIMDICAHTEKMAKDTYAMNKFNEIFKQLSEFYKPKYMLPKDVVFELHCRNYINRHAISDAAYTREIGKGLYLDLCSYDHSCRPNAIYTNVGFVATLRGLNSNVKLTDRSSTFYSYIDLSKSYQERKKLLKDTWYFDCECERCKDSEDHLLTSLKCCFCYETKRDESRLCIFGDHSYKDPETSLITCPQCDMILPKEYVIEGIQSMKTVDRILNSDDLKKLSPQQMLQQLTDLENRFNHILATCNIYFCNILQKRIEFVDPEHTEEVLRLHLLTEECVRLCFPKNHPAIAFHLRNIGIFYLNLIDYKSSARYLKEAKESLQYVLDENHPMTAETKQMFLMTLVETAAASAAISDEISAQQRIDYPKLTVVNSEGSSKEVKKVEEDKTTEKPSNVVKQSSKEEKVQKDMCVLSLTDSDDDLPELVE